MISISTISEGLTTKIRDSVPIDDSKAEIIEYGLYMAISEISKITVIVLLSIIVGMLPYSLVVIVTFGLLRNFAGGVHAKTHWGCFFSYCFIVFGVGYTSIFLQDLSLVAFIILRLVFYTACLLILYRYSPADVENKPVVSKRQRRYLRTGGFIVLTLLYLILFIIPQPYSNILVFSSIAQVITTLPIIYKVTNNKYGVQTKFNTKTAM